MSLDELLNIEKTRHLSFDEIDAHFRASSGTPREALEADSRAVAARYASGELDFSIADAIMNDLFAYAAVRFEDGIPQDTHEVFLAFDSGEFYPDAIREPTPEERFTKPLIQAFLLRIARVAGDGG